MYHRIFTFAFSIACLLAMVMFMRQANTTSYGVNHHSIMMKIAHQTSGTPHDTHDVLLSAQA